jgi:hypothetical protein
MECKEQYSTISRGGDTMVMVGRQRDSNRNTWSSIYDMARLVQTVDKYTDVACMWYVW